MLVLKITLLLVKNLFFSVKKGMSYWGFIFTWDLGVIFLGIPSFKILRFRKKLFFQIQILRFHRKMYKLFPCRPVCRGRERVFLFKKCKKNCMCGWVKNRIDTCEIDILVWKSVWVNFGARWPKNILLTPYFCTPKDFFMFTV